MKITTIKSRTSNNTKILIDKSKNLVTLKFGALVLFVIWCLGFGYSAVAAPSTEVSIASTITAVEIRGNKAVPQKEIMDAVFCRVGDSVVEEKVKADLKAIYALGYFSDVISTFEPYAAGSRLIYKVTENMVISNLVISGNTVFSTAEILARLGSQAGTVLNFKKMQEDIEKINGLYKTGGYMLARVVDVGTDKQTKTVTFKIIEGIVESVSLQGNENTKDYVILRELKTKPGAPLNEEVLKKDLRRIFNLGFFSEVTPNFEPGTTKESVVLQLKIKETRSSTVNFGGGYGEQQGWFGFVDLSINNLLGTAQGLMLRGQAGQQFSTYQFKYTNPWFWPEKLGDHTALTFRRWLTLGRDVLLTTQDGIYNGADLSFTKPWRENTSVTWTFGTENVSPYLSSTFEAYRADTLGLTLAYDTRDFWLNPREGRYYTLDLKQGWITTRNMSSFTKIGPDINHFYPLFDNQVLAFHAGAGLGLGNVPIGDLYWAGGPNTVRGYYPSQAQTGPRKLIANLEYRLNFSDMFQGVFFYDWGSAWASGLPNFPTFLTGWGPGIRVNTPLGPIRLDYGVPAGKSFGEGVMHFSIGQAF